MTTTQALAALKTTAECPLCESTMRVIEVDAKYDCVSYVCSGCDYFATNADPAAYARIAQAEAEEAYLDERYEELQAATLALTRKAMSEIPTLSKEEAA